MLTGQGAPNKVPVQVGMTIARWMMFLNQNKTCNSDLPIQISESLVAAAHMLGVARPLKGACLVFVEASHFHRQTTLFHDVEPRGISYCKDRHESCSPSSFRGLALFL